MTVDDKPINIAVLDDCQSVALKLADWSGLQDRANVTVFQDTVSNIAAWLDQDAASRGQDQ
jgi:hypothetical protein